MVKFYDPNNQLPRGSDFCQPSASCLLDFGLACVGVLFYATVAYNPRLLIGSLPTVIHSQIYGEDQSTLNPILIKIKGMSSCPSNKMNLTCYLQQALICG